MTVVHSELYLGDALADLQWGKPPHSLRPSRDNSREVIHYPEWGEGKGTPWGEEDQRGSICV